MADNLIVTVEQEQLTNVSSDLSNPAFVERLEVVGDVDTTANGKRDGSILVYKTTTNKWTSTTTLEAQTVEGGEF